MGNKSRLTKFFDKYRGEVVLTLFVGLLAWIANEKLDSLNEDIRQVESKIAVSHNELKVHSKSFERLRHLFVEVHPDVARALLVVAAPDVPTDLKLQPEQSRDLLRLLEEIASGPPPTQIEKLRSELVADAKLTEPQADFFAAKYIEVADLRDDVLVTNRHIDNAFLALELLPISHDSDGSIIAEAHTAPLEDWFKRVSILEWLVVALVFISGLLIFVSGFTENDNR